MPKTTNLAIMTTVFAMGLLSPFCLGQQKPEIPPAPVPPQILSAKKIFVSNAPGDFAPGGDYGNYGPYRAYNQFYASIKDWGYFELVSAPADADLIFEIRFAERPITTSFKSPQFLITMIDPKTHVPLWWVNESIQSANRASTSDKNYDQAMTNLVNDVKRLVGTAKK